MSTLQITRGIRKTAIRALIYGVEGIGKSTLGSLLPNPLFLDVEGSTNQLDVARIEINSSSQLESTLAQLGANPQGFASVVIDTADWAERQVVEGLLQRTNKKSIEDFGYGKGYTHLAEEFSRILNLTEALINKGVHVIWIAHSKVVRQSPPDQTDGFDRYELKLSKQVAPLLKEWCDLLLFAKFSLQIVEGTDGRIKAQGGKDRVLHTTNSAAWDAKNRFGLPDTIKLGTTLPPELAAIFSGKVARTPAPAPVPAAPPPVQEETPPPPAILTDEQLAQLKLYNQNSVGAAVIAKALDHYGEASLDLLNTDQAAKIISRCQEEMNKEPEKPAGKAPSVGAFPWPADVLAWLTANEQAVNAYLVTKKWITASQTFRDLGGDNAEKVVTKSDAFARAANIPTLTKAAA